MSTIPLANSQITGLLPERREYRQRAYVTAWRPNGVQARKRFVHAGTLWGVAASFLLSLVGAATLFSAFWLIRFAVLNALHPFAAYPFQ